MQVDILDYSNYGNEDDKFSDARIASALRSMGCEVRIISISIGNDLRGINAAENVWMRYDVRTMLDLHHVVGMAASLEDSGRRVFPSSEAILKSEDKWLTYQALLLHRIPAVPSYPVSQIARCGLPALVKPRPGWGGMGQKKIEGADIPDIASSFPDSEYISQPFVAHSRTVTVLAADGVPFITIEKMPGPKEFRTDEYHGGTAKRFEAPREYADLAVRALEAAGLGAGSVDLLENNGRIEVLEVNSAPGLFYTDIQEFDFALPLAKSALKRFK